MAEEFALTDINNHEALTGIFGDWPTFHDAEIMSIHLDAWDKVPSLEAEIHLWETTPEADSRGYLILKKHTLARLLFYDASFGEVVGFYKQNVLSELRIVHNESGDYKFTVDFDGIVGCCAHFECNSISVRYARLVHK